MNHTNKKLAKILIISIAVWVAMLITSCSTNRAIVYQVAPAHINPIGELPTFAGYCRPEESTYLSFPEWYIVYSSQAYAKHLKNKNPSSFPYYSETAGFWQSYSVVNEMTSKHYAMNMSDHSMLMVIGTSLSLEYFIKFAYENTLGRVFEWTTFGTKTSEDKFMFNAAKRYAEFIPYRPWYEFSFLNDFKNLWLQPKIFEWQVPRKIERRLVLSVEYLFKSVYASLIELGSHSAYGVSDNFTFARLPLKNQYRLPIQSKAVLSSNTRAVSIPRYHPFTDAMNLQKGLALPFKDIACNQHILLTYLESKDEPMQWKQASKAFMMTPSTNPALNRVGLIVPVRALNNIIARLRQHHIAVEHIYDY